MLFTLIRLSKGESSCETTSREIDCFRSRIVYDDHWEFSDGSLDQFEFGAAFDCDNRAGRQLSSQLQSIRIESRSRNARIDVRDLVLL